MTTGVILARVLFQFRFEASEEKTMREKDKQKREPWSRVDSRTRKSASSERKKKICVCCCRAAIISYKVSYKITLTTPSDYNINID